MKQLDYSTLAQPVTQSEMAVELPHYRATVSISGVFVVLGSAIAYMAAPDAWYFIAGFLLLVSALLIIAFRVQAKRVARIRRLAAANGLGFRNKVKDPGYKGIMYSIGRARVLDEVLVFADAQPPYEIGTYQYTTGSGKNTTVHYIGYVKLTLPRALPHIVLDGRRNNSFVGSNLPVTFDASQRLSLEGGFDEHYTLYAPREYKTDALYLFTPDVMAAFMDCGMAIDAEIVDNEMYIYIPLRLALDKQADIEAIMRLVDVLGGQLQKQGRNYRDERVVDPSVAAIAPAGARLRRTINVWVYVAMALYVALCTGISANATNVQSSIVLLSGIAVVLVVGMYVSLHVRGKGK